MSWIKWTHGLARKPEVMQVAHRLGRSRHEVAGILMELWEWADENVTIDETASGFCPDDCPGSVRLGEQSLQLLDATIGVAGLADALAAVGWIQVRNGSLVFPNFGRHNGKSAKARALDSARKRAERSAVVRNASGSRPDRIRTRREEKRREEKKEEPPNPPPGGDGDRPPVKRSAADTVPIPPEIDSPVFRSAWADWQADRKARGKTLTERAARGQLADLIPLGPDRTAECVRASIKNSWTGLFPERFAKPAAAIPPPAETVRQKLERIQAELDAKGGGGG